jgi:hypothetical protein
MFANSDGHDERRRRYKRVLSVIDHNTGGHDHPQRAAMRESAIKGRLCDQADHDVDDVETALRAALENDDVYAYEDREGRSRYCLATAAALKAVVGEENRRDDPDFELIMTISDDLDEVRDR